MATAKEKLTALADAIREKTGETEMLSLDAMTSLVKAFEGGGGGSSLPSGWATGTFNTTSATMKGDFEIEHGLNAVPHIVLIFKEDPSLLGQSIRGAARFNTAEEYYEDEGLYYPVASNGRLFYDNSSGTDIVQAVDAGVSYDTDKTFKVPKNNSYYYMPHLTYRWYAIRLGV